MQKIPRTEVRGNIKHILKLFVNPQTLMITGYLRSINATHSTCHLIETLYLFLELEYCVKVRPPKSQGVGLYYGFKIRNNVVSRCCPSINSKESPRLLTIIGWTFCAFWISWIAVASANLPA